jgi:adenylylsulfate kinase-like enzyme
MDSQSHTAKHSACDQMTCAMLILMCGLSFSGRSTLAGRPPQA